MNLDPAQARPTAPNSLLSTSATYTRTLRRSTTTVLSTTTPLPHTPLTTPKGSITFDYSNDAPIIVRTDRSRNPNWHAVLRAGTIDLIHKTTTSTPPPRHKLHLFPASSYITMAKIDNSVLHTYLARLGLPLASHPNLDSLVTDIRRSQLTDNILHWNLTSELQQLTDATHIEGVHPLLADPSLQHTQHNDTSPHLLLKYAQPADNLLPTPTETIFLIPASPHKCRSRHSLARQGYTLTTIPRHTRVELSPSFITSSDFSPRPSRTQWTIFHKPDRTQAISSAIHHASTTPTLEWHNNNLWTIFHSSSQYGPYMTDAATLVATDGSLDPRRPDAQMGGGIAYRPGDGTDTSIGVKGVPSSFGAEAGTLDFLLQNQSLDQPLNILTDSRSAMQQLQRLSKSPLQDLSKHAHRAVLQSIMSRLLARSAPTRFIKVKAHKGALLNERADRLADAGRSSPLTGHDPIDSRHIHYAYQTPSGWIRHGSTHTTDAAWKQKTQSLLLAQLASADTATFNFMTRQHSARQHFRAAIYQNHNDLSDTDAKRLLQAYTGTFPTNHKLWLMGLHPTGDCAHCPGVKEHMVHWQCLCPMLKDSRQAAHNFILAELHSLLARHAGPQWTLLHETPIRKTPFYTNPKYQHWQPDLLAVNNSTKTTILIEFTRCNDGHHDTSPSATELKTLKYEDFVLDLAGHNNKWTFTLQPIAIGYLTSTDPRTLDSLYDRLSIPTAVRQTITEQLVKSTAFAFAKMAKERLAALGNANPPHPRQ
jgi:hypothetical protein